MKYALLGLGLGIAAFLVYLWLVVFPQLMNMS